MPNAVPAPTPPALPRLPARLVLRETARIGAAFLLYLVLRIGWEKIGLGRLYNAIVLGVAERIFVPSQHFPVVSDLDGLTLRQLDFLVVFTVALVLVSTAIPWKRRLARFGLVLVVVFVLHVISILCQVKLIAAQDMLDQFELLLMLPLEFEIVDHLKYLLYDLGLQAGPFLLALLAAWWNAFPPAAREPRARIAWKRRLRVAGVAVAVLLLAGFVWGRWRESRPLHIDAHATYGLLCHREGDVAEAERHYRIAVERGVAQPAVYYNLAAIEARTGRVREAIDLLRRGLVAAPDPEWDPRLEKALADLSGNRR